MSVKNKKELQRENSELKEELTVIKSKYDDLSEKLKSLETGFKCNKCDENLANSTAVKKHKTTESPSIFKCEQCRKVFDQEWKLCSHLKLCKMNGCDQCDKSFKCLELKKKHVLISHENHKIYCHFFNNAKTCPYEEECVFLHENSGNCKYGYSCDRNYCMFKHAKKEDREHSDIVPCEHSENDIVCEDNSDKPEDSSSIHVVEVHIVDVNDDSVDAINIDEAEERQEVYNKVSDEIDIVNVNDKIDEYENLNEKILLDNNQSVKVFTCLTCSFKANSKDDMKKHKLDIHNWCSLCFSTFSNQDKLNYHNSKEHNN